MLALYRPDLAKALADWAQPAYRHAQICEHLFRRPLRPFSEALQLPAELRARLDLLGESTLTQVESATAADGTTKLLLAAGDRASIESVVMRYRSGITACISSQVGCAVGCLFCATGGMGFERNLTTAEIVDQVRYASAIAQNEDHRLSNVVYMGMGEPLLNLQAVLTSISVLTDPNGLGLAQRALSVSTVGIPTGMVRLGRAEPQVNLAVSLHAPDDATRALLIPDRFRHPVSQVLEAAWQHFTMTHRKLMIEYVLIRGVNDSPGQAKALARLLRGHVVTVNLLTWNPVRPARTTNGLRCGLPLSFGPSPPAAVAAFRQALVDARVETVVRRSKGGTIGGACGQLAGKRPEPPK